MKRQKIIWTFFVAFVYLSSLILCIFSLNTAVAVSGVENPMKIVLDAGHGGIDGGVVGVQTKVRESERNLEITLSLGTRLADMGYAVSYTRKTKGGLYGTLSKGFKKRDMLKRREIIENESPSFLISVHQNYFLSAKERGGTVFYKKGDEESMRLAEMMQKKLNALYQKDGVKERKAKVGEYYVLECSSCPSVLIECGFLSSPKDDYLLSTDTFKDGLVGAICSALNEYLFVLQGA